MQALGRGYNQRAYFKIADAMHKAAVASKGAAKSCDVAAREAKAAAFDVAEERRKQDEGATKMQALARGNLYRKYASSTQAVEIAARIAVKAAAACEVHRASADAAVEDAIELRAEYDEAATKLQSVARGNIGRKRLQAATAACKDAVKMALKAATAASFARVAAAQHAADAAIVNEQQKLSATAIQKVARGGLGRLSATSESARQYATDIAHAAAAAAEAADAVARLSARLSFVVEDENAVLEKEAIAAEHLKGDQSEETPNE